MKQCQEIKKIRPKDLFWQKFWKRDWARGSVSTQFWDFSNYWQLVRPLYIMFFVHVIKYHFTCAESNLYENLETSLLNKRYRFTDWNFIQKETMTKIFFLIFAEQLQATASLKFSFFSWWFQCIVNTQLYCSTSKTCLKCLLKLNEKRYLTCIEWHQLTFP